jgi:protein SCO1/2
MVEHNASRYRRRLYVLAGVLVLFAVVGQVALFLLDGRQGVWTRSGSLDVHATLLPEPVPVPAFSLRDQHGLEFTQDDLRGRWSLVAFGYTSCPDVCPTMLETLEQTDALLRAASFPALPNYLFITVDPERDTVARLARYISAFGEHIIGLTGDAGQIRRLADGLGIEYVRRVNPDGLESIVPTPADGHGGHQNHGAGAGYSIDHTAAILMLDPDGNWRALSTPPHDASVIADDYRKLVKLFRTTAEQ